MTSIISVVIVIATILFLEFAYGKEPLQENTNLNLNTVLYFVVPILVTVGTFLIFNDGLIVIINILIISFWVLAFVLGRDFKSASLTPKLSIKLAISWKSSINLSFYQEFDNLASRMGDRQALKAVLPKEDSEKIDLAYSLALNTELDKLSDKQINQIMIALYETIAAYLPTSNQDRAEVKERKRKQQEKYAEQIDYQIKRLIDRKEN